MEGQVADAGLKMGRLTNNSANWIKAHAHTRAESPGEICSTILSFYRQLATQVPLIEASLLDEMHSTPGYRSTKIETALLSLRSFQDETAPPTTPQYRL